jgi:hypothetical protein
VRAEQQRLRPRIRARPRPMRLNAASSRTSACLAHPRTDQCIRSLHRRE